MFLVDSTLDTFFVFHFASTFASCAMSDLRIQALYFTGCMRIIGILQRHEEKVAQTTGGNRLNF